MKDTGCYFCGRKCDPEHFCFGCYAYVCDNCDETSVIGGNHEPEDHRESEESET